MAEQSGDKTEEPTPHKLREARKKGQVAKSKEITTAVVVLVSYVVFRNTAEMIWQRIVGFGAFIFSLVETSQSVNDISFVVSLIHMGIITLMLSVGPIFIATFVAAVLVEAIQTQFVFAVEALTPKLEKLNPIEGFKRMFSLKGVVQMILSLFKIIIIFWITWSVIRGEFPSIITSLSLPLWGVMSMTAGIVFKIAMRVALFYIIIAILDYLYQKHEFHKSMMMTKQEVKEEYKRLEGDPLIKQRQRQAQREMAQKRMMGSVPKADVVVTNPVHIAVALQYDASKMTAPILLAKGKRLIAQEIKKIAEENNIAVVENEKLAQDLFKTTEVGKKIPADLYRAVAEILAFVYKLGRNKYKLMKQRVPAPAQVKR
ncbi:MAG: flagellar biosynthesis protein FlhB [Candidatus Margulisbacteria bacterium]|nr:flagellar biosynthesis protein FlhB [Candidatus Margulisiibacteriota bacterium]